MPLQVSKAILVGTGSSSSVPKLGCILRDQCATCLDAMKPGSKNNRLNPMFVVQAVDPENPDAPPVNIVIDCGKTFRESVEKIFISNGIGTIDGLLITHDHADAMLGLDDLREFSQKDKPIPVFLDDRTHTTMHRVFPYLFGKAKTWVAAINWTVFTPEEPVDVAGVPVIPFGVPHGKDYLCNAFAFKLGAIGADDQGWLLYISDVSEISDALMASIKERFSPIDIVILDLLSHRSNPTHFTKPQSIDAAIRLGAKQTYFTGMSHVLNYDDLKKELAAHPSGLAMEPGYDGMVVYEAPTLSNKPADAAAPPLPSSE